MNSDSNTIKFDYMKGHDYMDALFVGKYFILAIVFLSMTITAIYSYYYEPRGTASVVVMPGLFVGSSGEVTPVISSNGLSGIINEGIFNGLIQQKLKIDSKKAIKFYAYNPQDTNTVKITCEADNASNGLKILNELVAQLSTYHEKESALKLHTVSYKFIDDLRNQLLAAELSKIKKNDERRILIHEKSLLVKVPFTAQQDKGKIEEQIKNKEKEISESRKEIEKLDLNIITLKRQIISLDEILKHKSSIQVIQEPMMISDNFTKNCIRNIFTIGVLSLIFAMFTQFFIYEFKRK